MQMQELKGIMHHTLTLENNITIYQLRDVGEARQG
jgi:hypothetical protein